MQKIKDLKLTNIFILAIFIRLLVMPFYFHPDIKTYNFQASFLKNGVWDIYSYLAINKEKLPLKEEFVYFPLTYFFLGSYQIIASPLLGSDFDNWLSDASQQSSERSGVFRYLFVLKLPYLILDLMIAYLFLSFFKDAALQKKAFVFWLFNPFSLVLIYIFSNVDIIPVFLTFLSLLFIKNKKMILAALILGLAAAFKAYPLLFLPFLLLIGKDFKERGLMVASALGVFLLSIIAFLPSPGFREAALISGLTTRALQSFISIGFGETIIIPLVLISVIFFISLQKVEHKVEDLAFYYSAMLLILFSFIHFHIQWLLWLMPFMVLILLHQTRSYALVICLAVVAFSIPMFYEDKFMSVSLLSVISTSYSWLPIPFSAAQKFYDAYSIQSMLHSILAGGVLVFCWQFFRKVKG